MQLCNKCILAASKFPSKDFGPSLKHSVAACAGDCASVDALSFIESKQRTLDLREWGTTSRRLQGILHAHFGGSLRARVSALAEPLRRCALEFRLQCWNSCCRGARVFGKRLSCPTYSGQVPSDNGPRNKKSLARISRQAGGRDGFIIAPFRAISY